MLEKLTDPIFRPFRLLKSKIFQIQQLPATVKGEIGRARSEVGTLKSDAKGYASSAKGAKAKAQDAAQKAGGLKMPPVPVKKKMGFFSKKITCEGCGKKLIPSWDECPYCGLKMGASAQAAGPAPAAAPAPGGASRTMALDIGSAPSAGGGMLGWLIPLEGARAGELIEMRGRITVGKSPDNAVVFEEGSISGHHCEFVGSAMGFKLNDLGSTNGTFVNDKRVQTHDLVDNDNVTIGRVKFKFKSLS